MRSLVPAQKKNQHKDVCRYLALVPFLVNHLVEVDILATHILADRNERRYAAGNPRFPALACCALGVLGWWLTMGSIGSASRRCNMHAHWCLEVTKRWKRDAVIRLQRVARRWLSTSVHCECCDMMLNGRLQFSKHLIGKTHRRRIADADPSWSRLRSSRLEGREERLDANRDARLRFRNAAEGAG